MPLQLDEGTERRVMWKVAVTLISFMIQMYSSEPELVAGEIMLLKRKHLTYFRPALIRRVIPFLEENFNIRYLRDEKQVHPVAGFVRDELEMSYGEYEYTEYLFETGYGKITLLWDGNYSAPLTGDDKLDARLGDLEWRLSRALIQFSYGFPTGQTRESILATAKRYFTDFEWWERKPRSGTFDIQGESSSLTDIRLTDLERRDENRTRLFNTEINVPSDSIPYYKDTPDYRHRTLPESETERLAVVKRLVEYW